MIHNMYVIRDTIAEYAHKPFTAHNNNDAIRAFTQACQKGDMNKDDFTLYHIGAFDDINLTITAGEPLKIYSGLDIQTDNVKAINNN
jgi:hypothetical protein